MSNAAHRGRAYCGTGFFEALAITVSSPLLSIMLLTSLVSADFMEYSDDFSGATLDPFWIEDNVEIPGATITQGGGVLTIDVPVAPSDHSDAQLVSAVSLPLGNFTASVDFLLPQGNAMAWLYARQAPLGVSGVHRFGVYLWDNDRYNVWYSNDDFYGAKYCRGSFGNERTTWHRLELQYDAHAKVIGAYVDDIFLHSATLHLTDFLITLKVKDDDYYGPGPSRVQFDNFQFSYQVVPEPSSLILLVTCAGSLLGLAWLLARKRREA